MPRSHPRRLACALALGILAACSEGATATHARIALTPGSLDFGATPALGHKALTLTITNAGNSTLNVSGVRVLNDARQAFSVGAAPGHVVSNGAVTLEITYAAAASAASDSATLVVDSDAENAAGATVPLLARTTAPACDDGVKNGTESALDCGGTRCPGCAAGTACLRADDCQGGLACRDAVCGACATDGECRTGQRCEAGVCSGCGKDADCASGSTCVSGLCAPCPGATGAVDTRTDAKNCGTCGNVCPAALNAPAACLAGRCGRGPCERGFFDFDGSATPGCETSCAGKTCTAPDGTVTELASAPIPENALGMRDFASGASLGSAIQTGPQHTHQGVLGEATPPPGAGASELRGTVHRLQGGIRATMH